MDIDLCSNDIPAIYTVNSQKGQDIPRFFSTSLFLSRSDFWSARAGPRFYAARLDGPQHGVSSHAEE